MIKINLKYCAYAGIATMISYCFFTLISYLCFTLPFNPVDNWLSDLGNSTFNPSGAIWYNLGCIFTAIFLILSIPMFNFWSTPIRWVQVFLRIGQICEVGVCITLIFIGIFSEDFVVIHSKISSILVYFLTYFLIFTAIALLKHKKIQKTIPIFGIIMSIVAFIYGIFINIPLMEWITIFGALLYIQLIVFSHILFVKKSEKS